MPTLYSRDAWSSDQRLDILVLGPMSKSEGPPSSTASIRAALKALLREPEFSAILKGAGIRTTDHDVHIPDHFGGQDIIDAVLNELDTADLVVFDLSPKPGKDETSANVLYELGLVHALGIPALVVCQEAEKGKPKRELPFYASGMKHYRVDDFKRATLTAALRRPLLAFLRPGGSTQGFVNDRVSQFYGRVPIVDISAAVGLAIGYYENFLSRLLNEREGSFLGAYPDLIRQVVYVRPSGVDSTYQADRRALVAALADAGLTLETMEGLKPPAGYDHLNKLWFDHVGDVVVDLPRTIYPLRRSPRLQALHARNQVLPNGVARRKAEHRYHLAGQALLLRAEDALRYQLRLDAPDMNAKILHFTTIAEAPALIRRLLKGRPRSKPRPRTQRQSAT